MGSQLDVVGLGEICIDYVITVERFPEPDEKIFMIDANTYPGGVTANFVVGFSRLGGRAAFIGGVGRDDYGTTLLEVLRRENVDTRPVRVYSNRRTAVNIILLDQKGDRIIIQDPMLLENVPEPEEIEGNIKEIIESARILHTTAIKLESALKAAKIARRSGLTVSLDLERHVVEKYGFDRLTEMLRLTDILLPNKLGLRSLTGEDDLVKAGRQMLKHGPRLVVITMGSEGSIAITEDETIHVPAFKIKPVDTTGAGDAYNAAFLYAHVIRGLNIRDSSIFANAAAALKCLKYGAQTGLPTIDEVRRFLEKNNINVDI